ncbi:hypothetical protein [Psychromonas hadalis]|uniref:hypothetical protein n=1 Tax=Psychromonas hadalis TaxID=211669 RepID=UPI0003B7B3FB|nr:hypothetical protein [Psychromonas hadalis]
MKKRIEFPLLELILIIILLFTLAIFALPKVMDVGSEARIKTLNATALNLGSVNRLLYSRAVIKNVQNNVLQSTNILGKKEAGAYLVYGELRAQQNDLQLFLESTLFEYSEAKPQGRIHLYLGSYKNEACYINYQQARKIITEDGLNHIQRARYRIKSTGC